MEHGQELVDVHEVVGAPHVEAVLVQHVLGSEARHGVDSRSHQEELVTVTHISLAAEQTLALRVLVVSLPLLLLQHLLLRPSADDMQSGTHTSRAWASLARRSWSSGRVSSSIKYLCRAAHQFSEYSVHNPAGTNFDLLPLLQ